MKFISPTGQGIRELDSEGSGFFGAPRGKRLHRGADFVGEPGQPVVSPISGRVVRRAYPYSDDGRYCGALIQGDMVEVKMFYFEPHAHVIGRLVEAGQEIGVLQDLNEKYPGITPHAHVQVRINERLLLKGRGNPTGIKERIYLDPRVLLDE